MRPYRRFVVMAIVLTFSGCSDSEPSTAPSTPSAPSPGTSTEASSTTPTRATGTASTSSLSPTTAPLSTEPPVLGSTSPAPVEELVLAAYFVRGEDVALVHRTVPYTVATSRAAIAELLGGPSADEQQLGLTTAVPAGTALNAVSIDSSGIATVDLSDSFESGGGSLSMTLRLAQVVYTLTQFPSVAGVEFAIDGVRAEVFGPEGIVLDHPLARSDFEDVTPAIFVDGPAPFDVVGPRIRVHGTANVFEATFRARLSDASGDVLYEGPQMATSGTGTRGTFDFVVDVEPTVAGMATLRLWEPSAADGSDTNVIEIPVHLGERTD